MRVTENYLKFKFGQLGNLKLLAVKSDLEVKENIQSEHFCALQVHKSLEKRSVQSGQLRNDENYSTITKLSTAYLLASVVG